MQYCGMLNSDPVKTASRLDALATYMSKEVLSPSRCGEGVFVCKSQRDCTQSLRPADSVFFEGQLSHVGAHYDLFEDGRPLRIVVVGQESATGPARITLNARTAILMDSALVRRFKADGKHQARNPHMRGTTSALRLLLRGDLGDNYDGEFIDLESGKVHVFDAFALVNVLLCGAHPPIAAPGEGNKYRAQTRGNSTSTMRKNCLAHFKETLRILEPTVVVLQGIGVQNWTRTVFENRRPVEGTGVQLDRAEFEARDLYLCRLSHPSAPGLPNWGRGFDDNYLRRTVEPTLRRVRQLVLD